MKRVVDESGSVRYYYDMYSLQLLPGNSVYDIYGDAIVFCDDRNRLRASSKPHERPPKKSLASSLTDVQPKKEVSYHRRVLSDFVVHGNHPLRPSLSPLPSDSVRSVDLTSELQSSLSVEPSAADPFGLTDAAEVASAKAAILEASQPAPARSLLEAYENFEISAPHCPRSVDSSEDISDPAESVDLIDQLERELQCAQSANATYRSASEGSRSASVLGSPHGRTYPAPRVPFQRKQHKNNHQRPKPGSLTEHYATVEFEFSSSLCSAPFRVVVGQAVVVQHTHGTLQVGTVTSVTTSTPTPTSSALVRHAREVDFLDKHEMDLLRASLVKDAMTHAGLCGVGVVVFDASWHLGQRGLSLLISASSTSQMELFRQCMALAFPGKALNLVLVR